MEKYNFNQIKENYLDFLKQFLKCQNKLDLYLLAEENIFNINCLYFKFFGINANDKNNKIELSKEEKLLLKTYKENMTKIIKKLRNDIYNQWISSNNKEYILKSASGFNRKLKCYKRDFNFDIRSLNDPFTEDEIIYLQKFFNETYETEFNLNDAKPAQLTLALNSILTN